MRDNDAREGFNSPARYVNMTTRLVFFVTFLIASIAAIPAKAERVYALSMHGSQYTDGKAAHLSYVNPAAPQGGTLKEGVIGSFDTLNAHNIKGKPAQGMELVTDRLMARVWDEPFTLIPQVAQSVDMPADRSWVIFNLDPRARFHDGSAMTSDDVLFSYETLKQYGRPNMRRIYQLATPEILNTHQIKFTFSEGYDRETVMIMALMPILSKVYWQDKNFDETTLAPPLTSGPYKIAKVDPGRQVIFERVKEYWGKDLLIAKGQYNFDRIIHDYYRDDSVAFEAFKAGAFNLRREWDAGLWHSNYNFPALTEGRVKKEALTHGRPDRVRGFIMNTRRAPFDDIQVREALSYLFDFEWANQNLYHGQYKRIDSFYPNTDLAADDIPAPPVNATREQKRANMIKADEMLKQAGWIVKNGKRVHAQTGQVMRFEILADDPSQEKLALSFINAMKKMGIDARLRVLDTANFRARLNEYDFDMVVYFWLSTLSPGTEQYLYWSCESADVKGRWNYAGICDPDIDRLSRSIADVRTRAELRDHTSALDRLLMGGHYFVPLYYNDQDFVAYDARLHRPETVPIYGMVLESWWMEE